MRHTLKISLLALTALAVSSCYEDYIRDYDYSAVYFAYQYDMRTFVIGEGMSFKVSAALAGVMDNRTDREVSFSVEDALVTQDLLPLVAGEDSDAGSFTAFDVLSGQSTMGQVSQSYVTTDIKAAGTDRIEALPQDLYTLSDQSEMVIGKGRHTGYVTVKADSLAVLKNSNAWKPYYALGFRIYSCPQVDMIPTEKSFQIVVVRCENMLFGNWYHGGRKKVETGDTWQETLYYTSIPQDESRVYTLTTVAPNALTTNRLADGEGSLKIVLAEDGRTIEVSDAEGKLSIRPHGEGSRYNQAKLLQDRKIYLNYEYENELSQTVIVTDTLTFRNRIRDGVNEWQDENPEHYK